MKRRIILGLCVVVSMLGMVSCVDDSQGYNFIGAVPGAFEAPAMKGSTKVKVYHVQDLTIDQNESSKSWCSISPTSRKAKGDGELDSTVVTVIFKDNLELEKRSAAFKIFSGTLQGAMYVVQDAAKPE